MDEEHEHFPQNMTGNNNTTPTPTSSSAQGMRQNRFYESTVSPQMTPEEDVTGEDALLDLVQLEELHNEAEKMKALGNKHMASQEYTRAYNAYSAALQLSPVGPSSHVFLSNRAAALLSLKRYEAAATDARRAIALAPSFGKAHARLGQALYFLKRYRDAIDAYEDALRHEPDNAVTKTYLDKARAKLEKQMRRQRGDEVSMADTNTLISPSNYSVVTDHQHANVVTHGYRGANPAVGMAAARMTTPAGGGYDEDPDFDEALRIQKRANRYLANKNYKAAIEEYTAALFLVPDDDNLSPELHLGRAHALNGSRRHESAKNDSILAIRMKPSPAAFSTLAKSLFYLREYRGAVEAFTECQRMLPPGETLGEFDRAYLQKAEAAMEEEDASLRKAGSIDTRKKAAVPRLPPPRFVPREEAIKQPSLVPSMPSNWPQQQPQTPTLKIGPERRVVFLSEAMGIKLNRGPDGVVRVLSVVEDTPGSTVVRNGDIQPGDIIREAAGVDIRRPITNIMWGDTVALIKMAPRPVTLVVAQELSALPPAVEEELRKAASP